MNRFDVIVVDDPWEALGLQRPMSSVLPSGRHTPPLMQRSWRWSAAAILLTVLLHLVIGTALLSGLQGAWVADPIPNRRLASEMQAGGGDQVTTLILIAEDLSTDVTNAAKLLAEAAAATEVAIPQLQVVMPAGIELNIDSSTERIASASGEAPHARTPQGIYLDQIRARIERAWADARGARLAIGKCKVSIHQTDSGTVTEVEFVRCLSTDSWKQGLAQAIRYASPLPAPPDASVFSAEVSLDF